MIFERMWEQRLSDHTIIYNIYSMMFNVYFTSARHFVHCSAKTKAPFLWGKDVERFSSLKLSRLGLRSLSLAAVPVGTGFHEGGWVHVQVLHLLFVLACWQTISTCSVWFWPILTFKSHALTILRSAYSIAGSERWRTIQCKAWRGKAARDDIIIKRRKYPRAQAVTSLSRREF